MESAVVTPIPESKAFFEEDLGKKKPVIKTGAEIPFTRYFYKYQAKYFLTYNYFLNNYNFALLT